MSEVSAWRCGGAGALCIANQVAQLSSVSGVRCEGRGGGWWSDKHAFSALTY